mgnify:FL=1
MNKSEQKIIDLIRTAYKKRLAEAVIEGALEEVDLYDDRGNLLLTKDLKVKHKGSGYEYTVDRVEGEGDDAVVFLRHPEEPRIVPLDSEQSLHEKTKISLDGIDMKTISAGEDLQMPVPEKVDLEKDDLEAKAPASTISIDRKEFEKEYEVE